MYQPKFTEVSHDISVEVKPMYLEEESNAMQKKHVFAYFISIRNMGDQPVQLLKRFWNIEDPQGKDHEINGEGVIGVQPVIEPSKAHSYNSFCVLKSYRGSMQGHYIMKREDGKRIEVRIPKFKLISHLLN